MAGAEPELKQRKVAGAEPELKPREAPGASLAWSDKGERTDVILGDG